MGYLAKKTGGKGRKKREGLKMHSYKKEHFKSSIAGCYGPDFPVNLYLKGGFKIKNVIIGLDNLEDETPDMGLLDITIDGKIGVVFIEDIVMIEDL